MSWFGSIKALVSPRGKALRETQALQDADDDRMLAFVYSQKEPLQFASSEREIRNGYNLFRWIDSDWRRGGRHEPELVSLARRPELANAFIFHGNGRVREAALEVLGERIAMPVVFYGLVSRLNDWSPEVRAAARRAFERCFDKTSMDVLLPAVWVLLINSGHWLRWGGTNGFHAAVMARRDLVEALLSRLMTEQRSKAGSVFALVCQSRHVDALFPLVAEHAGQPHIRAMAVNFLSMGRVRFPLGTVSRQWVDKSAGLFRMVRDHGERSIEGHDLVAIVTAAS